jgi:hypothetical protein
MSAAFRGHERIDRRSPAMHRAIADKLRANPALIEIARDNLARWSRDNSRSQPYFDAWGEILNRPLAEVLGGNGGRQRKDDRAATGDAVRGRSGAGGALGNLRSLRARYGPMTRVRRRTA